MSKDHERSTTAVYSQKRILLWKLLLLLRTSLSAAATRGCHCHAHTHTPHTHTHTHAHTHTHFSSPLEMACELCQAMPNPCSAVLLWLCLSQDHFCLGALPGKNTMAQREVMTKLTWLIMIFPILSLVSSRRSPSLLPLANTSFLHLRTVKIGR